MRSILLCFFLLILSYNDGKPANIDSLKMLLNNSHDTVRISALNDLSNYYLSNDIDTSIMYSLQGFELAEKLKDSAYMNFFMTNIGTAHYYNGDFDKTVEYYLKALRVSEKYGDTLRIARSFNNLGIVNMRWEEYEKAISFFEKSIEIKKILGEGASIAFTELNMGIVFKKKGDYDKALEYFNKSLDFLKNTNNIRAISMLYNNIGTVYNFNIEHEKAIKYLLKAYDCYIELDNLYNLSIVMQNIGETYLNLNNFDDGFKYLNRSLEIAKAEGFLITQKNVYAVLRNHYKTLNNYNKAYEYQQKYYSIKDSIFTLEKDKQLIELQTQYETEKMDEANCLLTEKVKNRELETARQKRISYLLLALIGLILISAIISLYALIKVRKANRLLKQNKEKLEKLNTELNTSKKKTEEALSFKSEFLANMSHEIRTPLNIILGFTNILRKQISDKKFSSYLESIESSSHNLMMLLNDILDMSKIEASRIILKPVEINIMAFLDELKNIFSLKSEEKNIQFIIDTDDILPQKIVLDEIRLRQILFNILGNAIKFTSKGYVKLSVKTRSNEFISVDSEEEQKADIIFIVEDTGIGIPPGQKEMIFESFRQIKEQDERKFGGTGLGLPISKRLTEIMGGEIYLESDNKKGSKFFVHFRDVVVKYDFAPVDENNSLSSIFDITNIEFQDCVLLIADDEKLNRELIVACFENTNVKIIEAKNGKEAVEATKQYNPNIILMDLNMPVMDGFEATRILKNEKSLKKIPVLAFTASYYESDLFDKERKMFAGFVLKPVYVPDLLEEIAKYLPHKRKETISDSEDNLPVYLSKQKITIDQKLIDELKKEFIDEWKTVSESNSMSKIYEFANRLRFFCKENNIQSVLNYADELNNYTQSFDIEKVEKLLVKFPTVIDTLMNNKTN